MSTPTRSEKGEKHVWKTPQQASTQQVQGQKTRHTHPHVPEKEKKLVGSESTPQIN